MQEDLLNKINVLSEKVKTLEELKDDKISEIEELKKDTDQMIQSKDEEIKELKKRIDEMSQEFADMLRETLGMMNQKINEANTKWEQNSDVNLLKQFEDHNFGAK